MTNINNVDLAQASEILRAMAHPLRLKILAYIDKHEKINVNKIYNTLKLEQSITSQHLRIMRAVNVVQTERDGKFIYYSINYDKVNVVNNSIATFLSKDGSKV